MTWILGISAFYHDAAVALVHDGQIEFAASEERYSRRKHDARFPHLALQAGLRQCGLQGNDIDYVGFYEKPLRKFDRLLETFLAAAPRGYRSFATAIPSWLNEKLHLRQVIRNQLHSLCVPLKRRITFCEHHQSHAASAFFPSPFDEAAILTIDGVGEWATTCWGLGTGNAINLQQEIRFPHSLGLFYSAFTQYCGFRVNSGEYKLMGLAALGYPKYYSLLREHVIDLQPDGSFQLNMQYFGYCHGLSMISSRLERLLGFGPRPFEAPLRQQDRDLAASVQLLLEEAVLALAVQVQRQTQVRSLCLAGGVALNCLANSRLLRERVFENVWVQPAAGDAGGALGVAFLIWHQLLGNKRILQFNHSQHACIVNDQAPSNVSPFRDAQRGSLLGSDIDVVELEQLLHDGAKGELLDESELLDRVVHLLIAGGVIGWVQGRMEFGPRALGNRSILADPRRSDTQQIVNERIKRRESFRPFAPSVIEEVADQYFDLGGQTSSPYMLFTCCVHGGSPGSDAPQDNLSTPLPAITHADGTARVQTVSAADNPRFHRLVSRFGEVTGVPVLLNTSLNMRGEPLVCSVVDAWRCFAVTELDALVVDRHLFLRSQQPATLLERLANEKPAVELD